MNKSKPYLVYRIEYTFGKLSILLTCSLHYKDVPLDPEQIPMQIARNLLKYHRIPRLPDSGVIITPPVEYRDDFFITNPTLGFFSLSD